MFFTKLDKYAIEPRRANSTDAGLDLFALGDVYVEPGQIVKINTGIAIALEENTVGLILNRSSLSQQGLLVLGGVIDAGYRGELKVMLTNVGSDTVTVQSGKAIAQLVIFPIYFPTLQELGPTSFKELKSERGEKGYGSSNQ